MKGNKNKQMENFMNQLMATVQGFCLGIGLILASLVMRLLFHIGFCG